MEQAEYFLQHVPMLEARRHYSMAQLIADFREMFMPRYLNPEPSTEPPKPRKPWTPDENLPFFAWFEHEGMTAEQAESLVAAFGSLPEWARSVAPIDEARALSAGLAGPPNHHL